MLEDTDRIALAVSDRKAASETFARFFEAAPVDEVDDPVLGAKRLTLQWGRAQLELLEPTGSGPVARYLEADKRGIFLGGFALADPGALAALPEDFFGTGIILSRRAERQRVGLADGIGQISFAVEDLDQALTSYLDLLGIEDYYTSRGSFGAITWFDARRGGRLASLELLYSDNPNNPVARFVQRNGRGIYLTSIHTDRAEEIIARISPNEPLPSDAVIKGFVHPARLHGLFLGITTYENWDAHRSVPGGTSAHN
jgi:hypothetical protein